MTTEFSKHITSKFPLLIKVKVLVAISGGLDSVVLSHLLFKMGINIGLAHVNFQLRATESDDDVVFVKHWAEELAIPVFTHVVDTKAFAKKHKQSIQVAARTIRYQWFERLLVKENYDFVVTAHHADDVLETFFINLNRSTGLSGLTGIPSINHSIVRPLLVFTRNQIEQYALRHNLEWREDVSNASNKYLRNSIRHKLVPVLKEVLPNFDAAFTQTQVYLNQSQALIKSYIELVKPKVWEEYNGQIKLHISALKSLDNPKAVLYELLKDYGFKEWNTICELLDAQTGKRVLSNYYFLLKDRSFLILGVIEQTVLKSQQVGIGDSFVIERLDATLQKYCISTLSPLEMKSIVFGKPNEVLVDKKNLVFPLIVRKWKKGDYFYPLGMKGKKKISNFLIDQKIAIHEKEKIQLLCDANDEIVWVIGERLDNRYKITTSTKEIIKINTIA